MPWLVLSLVALAAWLAGARLVVFSSLAVMFAYVFSHFIALQIVSEMVLINSDRRHLRRLAQTLTVEDEWKGERPADDGAARHRRAPPARAAPPSRAPGP